jgi:hypothetical protein
MIDYPVSLLGSTIGPLLLLDIGGPGIDARA